MELEAICLTKLDCEMISCWINSNGIDLIINDEDLEYSFSFTRDQVKEFRECQK